MMTIRPTLRAIAVAVVLAACGGETTPTGPHHGVAKPSITLSYDVSTVAQRYRKYLGVDLANGPDAKCRVTYSEYGEDESEDPTDFWFTSCDAATQEEGERLFTEEMIDIYQEDSVSADEEPTAHCRVAVATPPNGHTRSTRLSADGMYSPETQAMLDYLFGVYDQYAPEP